MLAPSGSAATRLPPWLADPLTRWFGAERTRQVQRCLRSPDEVMRPHALAALKACNLSSARSLVKRMVDRRWEIRLQSPMQVERDGSARAIYRIIAEGHVLTFALRARPWDGEEKQGRRMEKTTDLQATLLAGKADEGLIESEMAALAIESWEGRTDYRSLGWTAANRSKRTFESVVECLAAGLQPDAGAIVDGGGYLVRNAGFFGNGRGGTISWLGIPQDHPLSIPYHVDIFSLYMWRIASIDYAEALAARINRNAARLSPEIKRYLGVGNSSGLGMTCAVVRWPQWVGSWCLLREASLAYAKSDRGAGVAERSAAMLAQLRRAARYYRQVANPDERFTPHDVLAQHLEQLAISFRLQNGAGEDAQVSWLPLCRAAARSANREVAEQVNAFLIDLYPEITDRVAGLLSEAMRKTRDLVPEMTVGQVRAIAEGRYGWALSIDQMRPGARQHFWYHSEELAEQRRGERGHDPGEELETFVDVVGAVQRCAQDLRGWDDSACIVDFVLAHPEHAYIVSRMQFMADEPYAEVRGNLIDAEFLPILAIRFLFSMFGFDSGSSVSNAWVRGVLLQGAPLPEDLAGAAASGWHMPAMQQ